MTGLQVRTLLPLFATVIMLLAAPAGAVKDETGQPSAGHGAYAERTERLLAAALETGDDLATARAQHDLARHMMTLSLWPQALTHAALAREVAQDIDDADTRVAIDISYASILQHIDRAAEATGILLAALEQTRALKNTEQELWALLGLSSAYVTARQLPEAEDFARQGLELARATGDLRQQVRFLSNLGLIAWTGGDAESAALHIRAANAVPVDELPPDVHKTLVLASITLAGTEGEAAAARARRMIAESRRDGSRYMEGFATEQLGHILCGEGAVNEGLEAFAAADALFRESDRLGDLRRLHERWAECLAGAGRFETALAHQHQAMSLLEEVHQRRQQETLQAHDIAFRTEQRLTELARLAGEEQALQVRMARQRALSGWLTAGALLLFGGLIGVWVRYRRLHELRDARVDLLARTSHEIRNPAQGIIGILEGNLEQGRTADIRGELNTALTAARMVGRLANDYLDLALLEQGRLQLNTRAICHVPGCVQRVMALGKAFMPPGRFNLSGDIAPAVPEHVYADCDRLAQVLLNLITNATHYAGGGDIKLSVTVSDNGRELLFTVTDQGPGFGSDAAPLLDPYTRGPGTTRNPRGSGLGLAISARIVTAMGGRIATGNQPGGGARLTVSVPLAAVPESEIGAVVHAAPREHPLPPVSGELRVLIVDDDRFARLGLSVLVESLGGVVRELDSGDGLGLELDDFDPNLVILDQHLDGTTGCELAARIRDHDQSAARSRHVVIISGSSQPDSESGDLVDGWLTKPVGRRALHTLLSTSRT